MLGSSAKDGTGVLSGTRNKTELTLWFVKGQTLELVKTLFCSPMVPDDIIAVRGKTAGAYRTEVTFQWTPGVQGLSVLLLRAAGNAKMGQQSILEGAQGSLACSLDSSIYKQTAWLDLFGSNSQGDPLCKRILHRTNPGLRRFGPVSISLNEKVLPATAIRVNINNQPLHDSAGLLRCADMIESRWAEHHEAVGEMAQLNLFNPLRL